MLKIYNRFTTYLLEHHPLLWHTKFIQLLAVGIFYWLLSYMLGYGLTNLEVLRTENITNYYERSNYSLFHSIFVIITLFIWALYFFKNNALKSFYPLKRGYYSKFLVYLFVSFFMLISAYIPFTKGVQHKTAKLLPEEKMEREIENYQLIRPFLLFGTDDYSLNSRVYPDPFPLTNTKYDFATDRWDNFSRYDTLVQTTKYIKIRDNQKYKPADSAVMTKIGTSYYIFYDKIEKYNSPDSCNSDYYIHKFYPLNAKALRLSNNSILNYSGYNTYNYDLDVNKSVYKKKFAPTVHDWVLKNKTDKIKASLNMFLAFCEEYEIEHLLKADLLLSYLEKKNYENCYKLTNTSTQFSKIIDDNNSRYLKSIEKNDSAFVAEFEDKYRFYLNDSELDEIMANFKRKNKNPDSDLIYFFLFFSLGFAWFFLLVEISDIISILVTIPVAGVISILCSLITVFMLMGNYNNADSKILTLITVVFLLLYLLSIILSRAKKVHRMVWNVSMNLSYLITPFVLPVLWFTLGTYLEYEIYNKCYGYNITQKVLPELENLHIFLLAFVSILLFGSLIKFWKAKAE